MKIECSKSRSIPLDDGDDRPELFGALPNVSSEKEANAMRYPGSPNEVLYKTEGHYTRGSEKFEVDAAQVEEMDRAFVPDGDIIGADPICYNHGTITRGPEKLDVVEYVNIFLDDDDENRGSRDRWVKCYQNGYINGEPVTRHYFANKTGTVQWDVKFYKGHSRIGGMADE